MRHSDPALLDAADLEKSQIVANSRMNRERGLAGVNSYEKELGLAVVDFLKKRLEDQPEAAWLDLCCGTGRALIQAAEVCRAAGLDRRVRLTGVDLVPMFESIPSELDCVRLAAASVERWETAERFDLITCVHGLHYVGDKLGLLLRASCWLEAGGVSMLHVDYRNLKIHGQTYAGAVLGRDLRRAGFRYVPGRHLLIGTPQSSRHLLPYRYLGADDRAGPNYTRQPAVDSYYDRAEAD